MEKDKVDMFIALNGKKFPSDKLAIIQDQLIKLDDSKLMTLQSYDYKNPQTLLIVSILLGGIGVDRFMLGQSGPGIVKLLTCGGAWVWYIIDIFNIQKLTKEVNFKKFMELAY